jgi:phosphate transport system substrate-binding protein
MRKTDAATLLCASMLLGCRQAPKTETLLIAGSSTMRSYMDTVVKGFVAGNPTASIVNEGGGSTAAMVALQHGAIDIASVARTITAKEDDLYTRDYLVARDGIAIVVNEANPVEDVTTKELAAIFRGDIGTWAAIGGRKEPVVLLDRDAGSNVRHSLQDLLLGGDELAATAKVMAGSAEMIAAVRSSPGAIGYVTLRHLGPGMKALKIGGVTMSRPTMLSGRYPLARSFYLVVHLQPSPLAERFIDFTLSKAGQDLLASDGLLEVF